MLHVHAIWIVIDGGPELLWDSRLGMFASKPGPG